MTKCIIVKHTAPKCWNVYIGDSNGLRFEWSLTDVYFNESDARGRAAYLLAFNDDVDGVLFFEEVR